MTRVLLASSVVALAVACSSPAAKVCTPGASVACVGPAGCSGGQVCAADGMSYGNCNCSGTGGSGGAGGGTASSGGGSTSSGGGSASSGGGSASSGGGSTSSGGGSTSSGGGTSSLGGGGTNGTGGGVVDAGCSASPTFAGSAGLFGSMWRYEASVGLAAGVASCQAIGADHVCDYDDLVYAAAHGELSQLSTTDTAWLSRNHPVTITATSPKISVLGVPATSGTTYQHSSQGSNCANWDYMTDHLNDGEWVDFSSGVNTPTFHLDDNPCAIQPGTKDIPCGHNTLSRSVLCCFPKNACNPAVPDSSCTCSGAQCM